MSGGPKEILVLRLFHAEDITNAREPPSLDSPDWKEMKHRPYGQKGLLVWVKDNKDQLFKAFFCLKSNVFAWWPAEASVCIKSLGKPTHFIPIKGED